MRKQSIIKFLLFFITFITIMCIHSPNVRAEERYQDSGMSGKEVTGFIDFDQSAKIDKSDEDSIINFANVIIGVVQIVGAATGVIMLIVMGMKYMTVAPSEKAEIKKTVSIYILGAILLFGATGVLEIIKQFALEISK